MKITLLCLTGYLIIGVAHAQSLQDSVSRAEFSGDSAVNVPTLRDVIALSLEKDYITIKGGYGNIEPLIFEASVAPHYSLSFKDRNFGFLGTFKGIFRMSNKYSAPVLTPSYMPRITLYGWSAKQVAGTYPVWSVMLSHHSNGQSARFFNDDGETNRVNGSFSTNFLEISSHNFVSSIIEEYVPGGKLIAKVDRKFTIDEDFTTSLIIHLPFNRSPELDTLHYGFYRLKSSGIIKTGGLSVKTEVFWIFGKYLNYGSWSSRRFGYNLTYAFKIRFIDDLDFMINFYTGEDYYNIWFTRRLKVLRFGLITNL